MGTWIYRHLSEDGKTVPTCPFKKNAEQCEKCEFREDHINWNVQPGVFCSKILK